MIIGLHGSLGSSKTWGAVYLAWLHQQEGFHIWSDHPLNRKFFPEYVDLNTDPKFNMEYLQEAAINGTPFPYDNIFMLFDEWQYRQDSRTAMSRDNRFWGFLFNQARKRGLVICFTSRMRDYVDIRAREAEDIIVRCFKKHKDTGMKCYDHRCTKPHFFEWWIIDMDNMISKKKRFMNPDFVFEMYQTKDLGTGMMVEA